jgi:hypothetical protein
VIPPESKFHLTTAEDRKQVLDQLDRLLASPLLNQSRRYSRLLRFIVESTVNDGDRVLKERIIGIEVFGRAPSYDTTVDPVVRTTTAQLRRRVAQYYQEPGHEREIVIDIPTGHYVAEFGTPLFSRTEGPSFQSGSLPQTRDRSEDLPPAQIPVGKQRSDWLVDGRWIAVSVSLFLLSFSVFALYQGVAGRSVLAKFWQPVLDSGAPTLICAGRPNLSPNPITQTGFSEAGPSIREYRKNHNGGWPPVAISSIAALLKANRHSYSLMSAESTSLSDLSRHSSVLVGALNNQWAMNLNPAVRFRYVDDHRGHTSIVDRENPGQVRWAIDWNAPFSTLREDYGIVGRFRDSRTGQITIIASGIVGYATKIAADFLTEDAYMQMIADRAPQGWEKENLEVVFSTPVANDQSGPPRILETYFWK